MRSDPWDLLKQAYEKLGEAHDCCGPAAPGIAEVRDLIGEVLSSDEPTTADVLRILSHELKGPVAAMVALLASVSDGYLQNEPVRAQEMVERARKRAEELLPLIDDILELSTLAAGEGYPRELVDLSQVCDSVAHLWTPLMASKGITLEHDMPLSPVVVSGSASFLRRVATNLTMNAFKYNRPGGRVTIRLSSVADGAVLEVSDTGVGIPPDDLPHIFSFLYRGRQARRNPDGGLGLGLSLVKKIVESHGGEIEARSRIDEGTTMIVTLPLASVVES
jgi:signal transduction histidine kinase